VQGESELDASGGRPVAAIHALGQTDALEVGEMSGGGLEVDAASAGELRHREDDSLVLGGSPGGDPAGARAEPARSAASLPLERLAAVDAGGGHRPIAR
jgi:hypothetical protein